MAQHDAPYLDDGMVDHFGDALFATSAADIPQNDDVSAYSWEFPLDALNMPGMAQGLSLPQPQSFAQNQINPYPQHDHVPQIYVDTSLPNNHPYPSMTPSSAYMSPMTPSYGDSSSTTDESGKFAYSPNTPFLSPNERYTHIASGTQSQTSSPTIRSQVEYSIKSEVSSPNRSPTHLLQPAMGSHLPSRGRSVSAPGPRGAVIVNSSTRGPIVPQKKYKPHTMSDRKRYVEDIALKPTIFFKDVKNGELIDGIPIVLIMQNRIPGLQGRDDSMLSDCGPSISVRINWPGYASWSRQIPTRDFRTPPQPVTRAKLAKNVAKTVERFIAEHQNRPMDDDGDAGSAAANQNWKIGGHDGIHASDLALVHLEHVSKGSWQVQLQLMHPRGTPPQGAHF
ncbi:uncharacterized protein STEHIDRAFT_125987 [Stereum hirsutum FP-91666 SS1]|uniref:Uncharacterized protein n=1 Tax=Stereum hirsutum (strain FP-91666) TaxID=721885 RepID=R7RYQ3_STEHR|nr:uncharacterized protein STEHIDRAFT_125987 [Stereum hirsutum FP-91666 SS1]EIM80459.1 hypothetical protein STEHIDRAFT_125987 [Stereum hirsutum FP-91666 SS1]